MIPGPLAEQGLKEILAPEVPLGMLVVLAHKAKMVPMVTQVLKVTQVLSETLVLEEILVPSVVLELAAT